MENMSLIKNATAPSWVKEAVFYQIFPDRFAKSDHYKGPGKYEPWGTTPTTHNLCGGNLSGIEEHLDYIENLGCNAIYFCPLFKSNSNHRYHTYDYFKIDPVLGTEEDFDKLIKACHKKKIRVILDGVFNHCSRGFFEFNSLLEQGPESPYKDWFIVDSFPVCAYDKKPNYRCWWNLPALPKFNTNHPEVREMLFSVGEYWTRKGIDGWRLDVPNEIDDDSFWQEFRTRVKKINPEAYIVGEIWDPPARWLQGDQFDGVMNYPLRRRLIDFILRDEPKNNEAFCDFLNAYYPSDSFAISMNLIGSHDTRRIASQNHINTDILKLIWTILFFLPGCTSVYYGDELALEGGQDPDNRRCFPWDSLKDLQKTPFSQFFKQLIKMRRSESTLQKGSFEAIPCENGFILKRQIKKEIMELRVFTPKIGGPDSFTLTKNAHNY
jgi:glycosidase